MVQPSQIKNSESGLVSEEKVVDKLTRFFHYFPIEFQQNYQIQLEYPFEVDDYLKNGNKKSRRSDFLLCTPSNVVLAEIKAVMLTAAMVTEVVVERRYLQRFEQENPEQSVKFMFLAPKIQPAASELITVLNAALNARKYSAVPLKAFVSDILSQFNNWCETNRKIISEERQTLICQRIKSDCSILFLG